jgi:anti-sigma factor RsiW
MDHNDATETKAVEQYLLGEMTESQRADFEEHFFTCPECAEAVRLGTYFVDNTKLLKSEQQADPKQAGRVLSMKTRQRGPLWRLIPAASGIAAALLLSVVGYQNLVQIPALRSGTMLVVTPTVLKGPVRGAGAGAQGPVIAIAPAATYVPVDVDLNLEKPFPYYQAELVGPSGQTIMHAIGEAPPRGTLEVELPARKLSPGPYILLIRGQTNSTGPSGPEAGRFPFELTR